MGLDVFSCSFLSFVSADEDEEHDNAYYIHVPDPSLIERLDGFSEGWYQETDTSVDFSFRAGSYSGYNLWREELCKFALGVPPEDVWSQPEKYKGEPFFELIFFSDCEGCIGPQTSAKLAGDFEKHRDLLRGKVSEQKDILRYIDRWMDLYDQWYYTFRNSSNEGFVIFG